MFRAGIILALLSLSQLSFSQTHVIRHDLRASNRKLVTTQPVTSIVVRSETDLGDIIQIRVNGKPVQIPVDPDGVEFSYFISLDPPVENPVVEVNYPAVLYLINSGSAPGFGARVNQPDAECPIEFSPIPQSEWRAGLAAPSYTRSFTEVLHVVVHHAAGSNTSTNYVQVVRDIYVYHTEVNGWSDIGYNYLIAQDGTVFAGRDPDGKEQDDVLGAHFCGKNGGTMGICLLGNYETAIPTTNALESLSTLVAFKIDKENLDPFGQYPHSSGTIDAILGHRDGCSTACPGENMYGLLNELRASVREQIELCSEKTLAFSVSNTTPEIGEFIIIENESVGYDSYKWLFPFSEDPVQSWDGSGTTRWNISGEFTISLIGYYGNQADTLGKEDFIKVDGPVVFPTLVETDVIYLNSANTEIESVLSIDGQETLFEKTGNQQYQIHISQSGMYFVKLSTGQVDRIIVL